MKNTKLAAALVTVALAGGVLAGAPAGASAQTMGESCTAALKAKDYFQTVWLNVPGPILKEEGKTCRTAPFWPAAWSRR